MKSDPVCGFFVPSDTRYPTALKATLKRPPTLFWRGNVGLLEHERIIAIVGSRHPSRVAERSLEVIISRLRLTNCVVASGLAIGLDALAHTLSLENDLPTIAVVGSSVEPNEIYPPSNRPLAERIVKNGGLILSPFTAGTPIERYNFPIRNRVLGSIAKLVIVASAAEKSGALSTVAAALDAGRDVAAVPGPITDALHQGSNALLKRGALVVTSADDIREYFSLEPVALPRRRSEDPVEDAILELISDHSQRIDDLVATLGIPPSSITTIITKLEIMGHVRRHDDGSISRAP